MMGSAGFSASLSFSFAPFLSPPFASAFSLVAAGIGVGGFGGGLYGNGSIFLTVTTPTHEEAQSLF